MHELYWENDSEGLCLSCFIEDFFSQYESEMECSDEEITSWRVGELKVDTESI